MGGTVGWRGQGVDQQAHRREPAAGALRAAGWCCRWPKGVEVGWGKALRQTGDHRHQPDSGMEAPIGPGGGQKVQGCGGRTGKVGKVSGR